MDQVTPSNYFAIVVFLQSNAEIAVLHAESSALPLKKPAQPAMVKREQRKKSRKQFRNWKRCLAES